MNCSRCHEIIMDGDEPVKLRWLLRLGMLIGMIPSEWYCQKCSELRETYGIN